MNRLWKSTTTVEGMKEPMVDWYDGATEAEARKAWDEDCHRYGLPMDKVTVVFQEYDRATNKPLDTNELDALRADSAQLARIVELIHKAFPDFKSAMGSDADHAEAAIRCLSERMNPTRKEYDRHAN